MLPDRVWGPSGFEWLHRDFPGGGGVELQLRFERCLGGRLLRFKGVVFIAGLLRTVWGLPYTLSPKP